MMTERPILFSGPMICATLDDQKTQTRCVVKPQPKGGPTLWCIDEDKPNEWVGFCDSAGYWVQPVTDVYRCPYGQPGDRLWVRETHALGVHGCENGVSYRADHRDQLGDGPAHPIKWRPSIFMPRWASRITLEIIDVRVELLRHISVSDAIAEGCPGLYTADPWGSQSQSQPLPFRDLWDSINRKPKPVKRNGKISHYESYPFSGKSEIRVYRGKPWIVTDNPWVFVVEFKRVRGDRHGR
jgi:hypothetical protein